MAKLSDLRKPARRSPAAQAEEGIPRPPFRWKSRVLLPVAILGGFLALLGATVYTALIPAVEVHAAAVVVKKLEGQATGAVSVQAAGWVEAEPYKCYVTALTDGIVREVLVLEGDSVKAGQVVVRLVDEDARLAVQRAEAKVRELEGALEAARAHLTAARTEWENPVERRRAVEVSEAQLAESRAALAQISAEISAEEANLEHVKSEYDRGVSLHGSSSMSESELVRRRSLFNSQKSKIEAMRMRQAATGELISRHEAEARAAREFMRLRTEERLKLEQSQAALIQAEASLSQARTALAEVRLRLERTEIRSPMDGIVMSRLTEPGSKVVLISDNPGSARVVSLYDHRRLQVRVDIPLADAGKIGVGQAAEMVVDVLPDRTFSGTVTRVLHEANIQKNTLEVKVTIADPDPQLRPEMLARVRFLAKVDAGEEEKAQRVFAPESAFKNSGGTGKTWVVADFDGTRGIAVSKAVKIGHSKKDGWVEVLAGLQPGDLVVTRSAVELKTGRAVRVMFE